MYQESNTFKNGTTERNLWPNMDLDFIQCYFEWVTHLIFVFFIPSISVA